MASLTIANVKATEWEDWKASSYPGVSYRTGTDDAGNGIVIVNIEFHNSGPSDATVDLSWNGTLVLKLSANGALEEDATRLLSLTNPRPSQALSFSHALSIPYPHSPSYTACPSPLPSLSGSCAS